MKYAIAFAGAALALVTLAMIPENPPPIEPQTQIPISKIQTSIHQRQDAMRGYVSAAPKSQDTGPYPVLEYEQEAAYNEKYIIPYNPQVGDICVMETRKRSPIMYEAIKKRRPEISKDDYLNINVCTPAYRDIHPLTHHDLEALREMAEYDPEAAMWIVENNLVVDLDEQIKLVQHASKLSGKTADLELFMLDLENLATRMEEGGRSDEI